MHDRERRDATSNPRAQPLGGGGGGGGQDLPKNLLPHNFGQLFTWGIGLAQLHCDIYSVLFQDLPFNYTPDY